MEKKMTIEDSSILAHLLDGNISVALKCIQKRRGNLAQILNTYLDEVSAYLEEDDKEEIKNEIVQMSKTSARARQSSIVNIFFRLVDMLQRIEYRTILLATSNKEQNTIDLTSKELFKDILEFYGIDRGIVLQPESIVEKHVAYEKLFKHLEVPLNNIDEWPAILVWKGDDMIFVPVGTKAELFHIYKILREDKNPIYALRQQVCKTNNKKLQIIHISDLHCGARDIEKNKKHLLVQLTKEINRMSQTNEVEVIISGDCVDHPVEADHKVYRQFIEVLKQVNNVKVNVILGNHDCTYSGLKGLSFKEGSEITDKIASKDPIIEIIKKKNLIIIQLNSNKGGLLAQGEVGMEQLIKVDRYLETIESIQDYTLMVVLHHHPIEVQRPDWYAGEWYENIYTPAYEATLKLVDSEQFMKWANDRSVRLILHGHRHIPDYNRVNGTTIIGCGSSTGKIVHVDQEKTYITYNVINYNVKNKKFTSCVEWYAEVLEEGFKNSIVHLGG